jgi:hypothetical protein
MPDAATGSTPDASTELPASDGAVAASRFKVEVWADNWFALWVGETKVAEDSVPITTERSFNAETATFTADLPFTLNFIIKDFTQNETGLEYIGLPNQQMGDGGFIMQVTDLSTGRVISVSSRAMKCLVINKAPLNPACEKDANPSATCLSRIDPEPAEWKSATFDASSWESATVFTAAQVGPKEGYATIRWDSTAQLVWTADLKTDNTLLCKLAVR